MAAQQRPVRPEDGSDETKTGPTFRVATADRFILKIWADAAPDECLVTIIREQDDWPEGLDVPRYITIEFSAGDRTYRTEGRVQKREGSVLVIKGDIDRDPIKVWSL